MHVILLEKMRNLGNLGDEVKVRPGYARNFLVPRGMAAAATAANRAQFEERRAELERKAAEVAAAAQGRASAVEGMRIVVRRKAGDGGRLFGSVGNADIAAAITAAGTEVNRSEVRMSSDSIRQLGEYEIAIHLGSELDTKITLVVEAE